MPLSKDVDVKAREFITNGKGSGLDRFERNSFLNSLSDEEVNFLMTNAEQLNGDIKKYLALTNEDDRKKALIELQEKINASKKVADHQPVPQISKKDESVAKKDIKADLNTRRLLIDFAAIVFDVQPESNTLPDVLAKVRERHQAFCNKASSFLEHIAPGSTAIKAAVEGHGTVQLFANFFGIQPPVDSINESSELGALTTVWVNTYKKEWAGTNAEMSDADRILRFEEKKKRIIEKTADEIAAFAGYESKEDLIKELTDIFKTAVDIIKEHVTSR